MKQSLLNLNKGLLMYKSKGNNDYLNLTPSGSHVNFGWHHICLLLLICINVGITCLLKEDVNMLLKQL